MDRTDLILGKFFMDLGPIPQKAASWGIKGQRPVPRSRGLSILTMIAAEHPMMCLLSLDKTSGIPNACHFYHSSTVHDQNRSECPKTSQVWKSYRKAMSSVSVRFLWSLSMQLLISLTPDVISCFLLIVIPYCMLGVNARFDILWILDLGVYARFDTLLCYWFGVNARFDTAS